MSGMVMMGTRKQERSFPRMGTRKLWMCWQGTLRWNTESPWKYVGTGT